MKRALLRQDGQLIAKDGKLLMVAIANQPGDRVRIRERGLAAFGLPLSSTDTVEGVVESLEFDTRDESQATDSQNPPIKTYTVRLQDGKTATVDSRWVTGIP